jgi:hypothetical protein
MTDSIKLFLSETARQQYIAGRQLARLGNRGDDLSNDAHQTRLLQLSDGQRRKTYRLIFQEGFCTTSLGLPKSISKQSDEFKLNHYQRQT